MEGNALRLAFRRRLRPALTDDRVPCLFSVAVCVCDVGRALLHWSSSVQLADVYGHASRLAAHHRG